MITLSNDEWAARFRADARGLGANREIEAVSANLWESYGAPTRHYHSRQHVAECLALLDDVRSTLASPSEVALALWFHDAVYATYPFSASESRSASLAHASCIRMGIAEPIAKRIAAMVRSTKKHVLESGTGVDENDARAFLDIDLAILGAGPLRYAEYERDIRAEYGWVPRTFYLGKRAGVLRAFAQRPRIYHHPALHERFEASARRNLEGAVSELTAPLIVGVPHATDEYVVITRAAELSTVQPWSSLEMAAALPSVMGGPPRLSLAFGPFPHVDAVLEWDAPYAVDVVERVRSLPGYELDVERRAKTSRMAGTLYHRERHPPVTGPLVKKPRSVYR